MNCTASTPTNTYNNNDKCWPILNYITFLYIYRFSKTYKRQLVIWHSDACHEYTLDKCSQCEYDVNNFIYWQLRKHEWMSKRINKSKHHKKWIKVNTWNKALFKCIVLTITHTEGERHICCPSQHRCASSAALYSWSSWPAWTPSSVLAIHHGPHSVWTFVCSGLSGLISVAVTTSVSLSKALSSRGIVPVISALLDAFGLFLEVSLALGLLRMKRPQQHLAQMRH